MSDVASELAAIYHFLMEKAYFIEKNKRRCRKEGEEYHYNRNGIEIAVGCFAHGEIEGEDQFKVMLTGRTPEFRRKVLEILAPDTTIHGDAEYVVVDLPDVFKDRLRQ